MEKPACNRLFSSSEYDVPDVDTLEKLQEVRMDALRLRNEFKHTRQKKARNLYLKEAEILEAYTLGIRWAASYVKSSSRDNKMLRLIVISDDLAVRSKSDSPISWSWLCNAPEDLFVASLSQGVMERSKWQESFKSMIDADKQTDAPASPGSGPELPSFWEHLADTEWVVSVLASCPDDCRGMFLDLCLQGLQSDLKAGGDWRRRVNLIECIGSLAASEPSPAVSQVLYQVLEEDQEPFVRRACVEAVSAVIEGDEDIGLKKLEGSTDAVCKALHDDPSATVRLACARALQSLDMGRDEILQDIMEEEESSGEAGAIFLQAFQEMRTRLWETFFTLSPPLIRTVQEDSDARVRSAALEALVFITPEIDSQQRREESVQRVEELEQMLLAVYRLLQAKLSDADMRVRNTARQCLKYSWIAINRTEMFEARMGTHGQDTTL
eukprot:749816-Hanusia_phi.AAC.6